MSFHDANAKYFGVSLVSIVGLGLTVWGVVLIFYPPAQPLRASSENVEVPMRADSRSPESGIENPSKMEPQTKGGVGSPLEQIFPSTPAFESWGYVFPNESQLYSVRFSGFPSDLDDDAIQAIFRNHLLAIRQIGTPGSTILFRATVDSNQQSERCASLGGISAVVEAQVKSKIELSSELFKTGHGFACFGSDGRTAEIEAIGQAFASMKN